MEGYNIEKTAYKEMDYMGFVPFDQYINISSEGQASYADADNIIVDTNFKFRLVPIEVK